MPMFNNRVIKIPEKLTIDSTSQFQHITHCLGRLEWRMAYGWQSSDQNPGYPVPGPALWEDVHGKTREGTFGQCQRSLTGHAFLETARRHRPVSGPFSSPSTYLITASTPVLTVTYLKPGCLCCRRTQQGFVLSCSRQFSWTIWGSASQPLREFACEWAWLWSHWWDGEWSPSHSEANESINPSWPSFPGRIPRLSPPPTSNPALAETVGTASFPPAGCLLPRLPGTPPQPALSSPQAYAAWKPFPFLSRDLPANGQSLL